MLLPFDACRTRQCDRQPPACSAPVRREQINNREVREAPMRWLLTISGRSWGFDTASKEVAVRKDGRIFLGVYASPPWGVAKRGGGSGGFSGGATGSADPGEAIAGTRWILLIHCPIACLSVSGAVYRLYGAVINWSSDPGSPSHRPRNRSLLISFHDILGRNAANCLVSSGMLLYSTGIALCAGRTR